MLGETPEGSLEQLVPEEDFALILGGQAEDFLRLSNSLLALGATPWSKRHFYQLYSEADELESFLDDHGARYNEAYSVLTELVASVRNFATAGLSVEHLNRRLAGYGVLSGLSPADAALAQADARKGRRAIQEFLLGLLGGVNQECAVKAIPATTEHYGHGGLEEPVVRFRLPMDLGREEIEDEELRIAEVLTKFIQATAMLEDARFRRIPDAQERNVYLNKHCSEELARVYEATVHNLQSTYDTYITNTVLESGDPRLVTLRGHISTALHLLESVTQLSHFLERHESDARDVTARERLSQLAPRAEVSDLIVNQQLYWAGRFMQAGRILAEELLPAYTNLQVLEAELAPGLVLHARPASLIVSIVNHHGTPVELEVSGQRCNAGSILEFMVAVGSNPDEQLYTFRGDEHPLRDIALLFKHGLGEQGLDELPDELGYLRGG